MYDLKEIAERYKKLHEDELVNLAKQPRSLVKEVVPLLCAEIARRNLDKSLIQWIGYSTHDFEGEERVWLKTEIQSALCSICNVNSNLKGYVFTTKVSAMIMIHDISDFQIICYKCARKKRFQSMGKTFLMGWWSKRGILGTPIALISDSFKILTPKRESKRLIEEFIDTNTGYLRIQFERGMPVSEIIRDFNKQKPLDLANPQSHGETIFGILTDGIIGA